MKKLFLKPVDSAFLREEYITDAEYLETRDFKNVFQWHKWTCFYLEKRLFLINLLVNLLKMNWMKMLTYDDDIMHYDYYLQIHHGANIHSLCNIDISLLSILLFMLYVTFQILLFWRYKVIYLRDLRYTILENKELFHFRAHDTVRSLFLWLY